jgi:2-polyprenyl-6-methoxyphenol hydroxylase-like FAD-dependent oxidoreductase
VGAGPVGLTVATNLAKLGVKVLILERSHQIDQSPRAASYQPCAQAELLEIGTLDDVKKESVINDVLSFWVKGERVAYVEKREGGSIFPAGINCPQPQLAAILLRHLTTKYDSEARFNQKVIGIDQNDGSRVEVIAVDPGTEKETKYTCDWLVGADGAGSGVRKICEIPFEGFSWPKEDFVATNLRYNFFQHGFTTANFIADQVHWPVMTILDKSGLWRCAFGIRAGLTNEEIRAELDEHYKKIFPVWPIDYELVQLNKYKPHQRCAKTFQLGRVMLAGDAPHVS